MAISHPSSGTVVGVVVTDLYRPSGTCMSSPPRQASTTWPSSSTPVASVGHLKHMLSSPVMVPTKLGGVGWGERGWACGAGGVGTHPNWHVQADASALCKRLLVLEKAGHFVHDVPLPARDLNVSASHGKHATAFTSQKLPASQSMAGGHVSGSSK